MLLVITRCSTRSADVKENQNVNAVLELSLQSVLDSLHLENDLKEKILVHTEFFPDNARTSSVASLIDFLGADTSKQDIDLLRRLKKTVNDSLVIWKDYLRLRTTDLYFHHSDSLFKSPKYFGTFSLSNPILDNEIKRGCYYFAINCGNVCSKGYIIFLRKDANSWKLDDFFEVWHG